PQPADPQGAAAEAVSDESLERLLHLLLEVGAGHRADRERAAGAHVPRVAEVVVEPLELEQERAAPARPRRWRDPGDLLDGPRDRNRVRERAGAAGALGDEQRALG